MSNYKYNQKNHSAQASAYKMPVSLCNYPGKRINVSCLTIL